jgi:hypothetical protein
MNAATSTITTSNAVQQFPAAITRQVNCVKWAAAKQGRIAAAAEQGRLMVMAAGSRAVINGDRLENFLALAIDQVLMAKHLHEGLAVCPACNGLAKNQAGHVHSCGRCDAVFTSQPIERQAALEVVNLMGGMVMAHPAEPIRHFDLDTFDLEGRLQRHHGWMNAQGDVVQWG